MTATNLPTKAPDISRLASDTDKLGVLTRLLAAYPSRTPKDFRLVKPAYLQALESVSQWALFEAERRINQNALGHGFMPSPSELRGEIDRVMKPILERRRRAAEEARRYAWPEDESPRPDEAARARMRERLRQVCRWREANPPDSPRAKPQPPRPPRQIPDYSQERIEITDALRRTLKAKEP
ncbi:hypothetical protein CN083_15745 [Sinorhizobium meliloti]|uniref:hypothetical protein n=1 Tax=Rhizobium meliloti TaxID=382 RepID=UPI000FDA32BC|nr:hypothetical protein [Sinorhizobium meliloti]RVP07343.1 hypothetical protein CN083_15745 [Sinorhizobium meliloti]